MELEKELEKLENKFELPSTENLEVHEIKAVELVKDKVKEKVEEYLNMLSVDEKNKIKDVLDARING
jgi:hypothetical protein